MKRFIRRVRSTYNELPPLAQYALIFCVIFSLPYVLVTAIELIIPLLIIILLVTVILGNVQLSKRSSGDTTTYEMTSDTINGRISHRSSEFRASFKSPGRRNR